MKTVLLAILGLGALCMTSFSPAWAAFDPGGNYYCNSVNLPLEQAIYKSSVARVNDDLNSYLSLDPSATDQELHNYLISNPDVEQPFSIMEQSKACLQSNGISPSSVAAPSSLLLEVFAAPEFGIVSGFIFAVTFASVVILSNKINRSALNQF
ncbi:MAG: hypothetical protein ACREBB_00930 [Nitrosotalea sp.]